MILVLLLGCFMDDLTPPPPDHALQLAHADGRHLERELWGTWQLELVATDRARLLALREALEGTGTTAASPDDRALAASITEAPEGTDATRAAELLDAMPAARLEVTPDRFVLTLPDGPQEGAWKRIHEHGLTWRLELTTSGTLERWQVTWLDEDRTSWLLPPTDHPWIWRRLPDRSAN